MSYMLSDVEKAERRIRVECPDALIERFDYGFGLSVAKADLSNAFVVFRPPRDDIGQTEIVSDVDVIIAGLGS